MVYLSHIDAKLKKLRLILRLARLHFLIPGFMLYLLGYLLALLNGSFFDFGKFVFGYLIFGTAHLSVSFSNDYFDRYADKNSVKTAFSGGSKILVEHPDLAPMALKIAIFLWVLRLFLMQFSQQFMHIVLCFLFLDYLQACLDGFILLLL